MALVAVLVLAGCGDKAGRRDQRQATCPPGREGFVGAAMVGPAVLLRMVFVFVPALGGGEGMTDAPAR